MSLAFSHTRPPLAIVGASTRSAAASAVRAGFQPLAADLFADADLRTIATATRISPYPEGMLDWLRVIEPPAWMYTGALENYPQLVDQMAWIAPLWGNPGEVLERVRSPLQLADALRSAGLLFPETRSSADGLPADGSWLAKSYQGASGSGVRVWGQSGRQRSDTSSLESPRLFYQQRIAGTPCAAVFVAAPGRATLLGVTRQLIGENWLGAHGFQYAGSIGPWPVSEAVLSILTSVGNVLAERFELVGLFGVDFLLDGGQVWTIEVNPRYTASVEIVERMTGVRAIELHARACKDESLDNERAGASSPPRGAEDRPARSGSLETAHGKATLFARQDIIITEQFARSALAEASKSDWPALADISPAGTPVDAGRPVLTLFAAGASAGEVEDRLRRRVVELEQKIYGSEGTP